ncbi:LOW QUALITY PROTEIN: hypothetical protein Cgig2_016767 [Carnegiea gigantea]|uniref:Uncharacterized protein n=1 Tax=Carnegiea gigantea TaxID=171969 RepID=A0A9Q1GYX4_9CARY|nr:LOW QUALITY PROTEIN: hypothetical protein Cgig2_016767 [Carnegiea gigantea]
MKLHGHDHMGLLKETDTSRKGYRPTGPSHPRLWEVNPIGMIRLPLCFGDKGKKKNEEVDFLVVDVPIAYNIILIRPTLHKLQFEADDESVSMIQGDRRMAQECYLVTIWPLVERMNEKELGGLQVTGKKPRTGPPPIPPPATEALTETDKLEREEKEYISHTSAMTTRSSVTLGGSEVLEAAKSYNLARSRTNSSLAAKSVAMKPIDRAWWVVLCSSSNGSPKGIPDGFIFILTRKVSPMRVSADKEEVIFPMFHFGLLLNGHHIT